ncbi:MAG: PAS-domain containing protein [Alphaproteobacteria bacterium]|nr:PAS-domain containing protein [Alphaproteobacteria bacterium]
MSHFESGTAGSVARSIIPGANLQAFNRVISLEQSLDHLPIGITVYDENFRLTAWNKTVIEILRMPPELLRDGMPISEIIRHLAAAGFYGNGEVEPLTNHRLRQMTEGDLTFEHRLNDGRVLENRGFRDPGGGYIYIIQDVTAQRQAESATKELAAIVSSSEAAILSLSPEGNFISWNAGAERLYGYSAKEAIGQSFRLLRRDAAQDDEQQSIWRRVLQGEQVLQAIVQRRHKDGHTFSVSLSMSPIFADDGTIVGASGIAYDVTERLQAVQDLAKQRDELERLNGQKNRLFSIIAHDLRTPFNSLLGFSEILSDNAATLEPKEISEYAGMMHESARQANGLLETLLEWSRLQMGGLQSEPRPFDVAGAIDKALAFNATSAANKNIMTERLASPLLTALADPRMVETVLRNLIGNAIKFTERDGTVHLEASRKEGEIVISVCDSGVGISPERLGKLFQFETDASTAGTDGEKGTGLGLQLCKELVELQGGAISVESTPGQGSRFCFTLPSAI